MSGADFGLLFLSLIGIVIGLILLVFPKKRRLGKWLTLCSLLGIVVSFGIFLAFEDDFAREDGFLDKNDKRAARAQGYVSAKDWKPVREKLAENAAKAKAQTPAATVAPVNSLPKKSSRLCAIGEPISGKAIAGKRSVPVLNGPSESSGSMINQTASAAFNRQIPETLSPSADLELLCESNGYVQVIVTGFMGQPPTPPALQGWVKKESVSTELTEDQKRGLFWDFASADLTPEDRSFLRVGALKILNDDKRCLRIDGGSKGSSSGGKQYYVTCGGSGGELFNVFFDKADAIVQTPLKHPEPFDETSSRRLCEAAIKESASHPSTVNIHSFMGYATKTFGNGNRFVWQTFSAKNSYGLELTYQALCTVTPDGKSEITISEKK
ncbi:hypothetical protein [Bradyrhizobium elkanii]|uniref:Uncharacterized protein n=1 Tax=Bradyrhizobium elkanii TaxID=29448 RepID=A0ABV4F0C4_BRAEL|nr:hypothetical protein [Bradyrhizobium elkanii]MCP1757902.1 hypothetical protein [Bradyrhizobium elkanii]MCS3881801.1 hypothetical protein [Bradyrhizobium elkanii]MCS4218560.1 hypothetical protein [Bradyrhizobium elkanii]MCW2110143.1 hypothetical protein [Bradyrhizobium elkanii]MCW2201489.1 hypothetical protein [Bradyrhizobium elkanii]